MTRSLYISLQILGVYFKSLSYEYKKDLYLSIYLSLHFELTLFSTDIYTTKYFLIHH